MKPNLTLLKLAIVDDKCQCEFWIEPLPPGMKDNRQQTSNIYIEVKKYFWKKIYFGNWDS